MPNLRKHFAITSRDDVLEICDHVTQQIQEILASQTTREKPILIIANGDAGVGKSIFWDRIRERLFKHGGIFINKDSKSSETNNNRIFETWTGELKNTPDNIKLFCCNMRHGKIDKLNDMVTPDNLNSHGDIIILSNVPANNFSDDLITLEIDMELKDSNFADPKAARWNIAMTLSTPTHAPYSLVKA